MARTLERVKVTFKGKVTGGHLTARNSSGTKASIGQGKARVLKKQLAQPVNLGGFEVDEQFTRIVWRARKAKRDRIAPGQFQDFPLSVRVPGSRLVFRAFQTYQRGERVASTGAPDSDSPAPRVTLLAPEPESH